MQIANMTERSQDIRYKPRDICSNTWKSQLGRAFTKLEKCVGVKIAQIQSGTHANTLTHSRTHSRNVR